MSVDERVIIITDMLQIYAQNVQQDRVKAILRHLEDIKTETLRVAVARCVQHGSQRGAPSVAEIRRAVNDLAGTRRQDDPENGHPHRPECQKVVHRTKYGRLLCCLEPSHMGPCEVWFSHDGPRPGDAETIRRLLDPDGKKPDRAVEDYDLW